MSEREFQMRMSARYEDENKVNALRVENLEEGEWKPFELSQESPGFLVFVFAVLNCQHLYMRTNCAERGLMLESAEGHMHVVAAEDWEMRRMHVRFEGRLRAGTADADSIDYIVGRMGQCPVSVNVRAPADSETRLVLS